MIEDDPTLADVVGPNLVREGFEATFASDGIDGLEAALSSLPDLVVLVRMLPGLDGLEVSGTFSRRRRGRC